MKNDIKNLKEMTEAYVIELWEATNQNAHIMAKVINTMPDLRKMIMSIKKKNFSESSSSSYWTR